MPSLLLDHVGIHNYMACYLHLHVHNHFHHHKHIAMGFFVHSVAAGVIDHPTENPISVPGHINAKASLPKNPFGSCYWFSLLEGCADIKTLQQVHAHMVISGLDRDMLSTTKLVNMICPRWRL